MSLGGYSLFIAMVAGSNLLLGFSAAVTFGHGPRVPEICCPWRAWLQALLAWRPAWPPRWGRRSPPIEKPDESEPSLTFSPIKIDHPAPEAAPGLQLSSSRARVDETAENSLDAVLSQLSREVAAVRGELGDIDQRVRICSAAPTVSAVEECVADLKQTGQRLYQQQTQTIAATQGNSADSDIAGINGDAAFGVVEQQTEQLRQSLAELDAWCVDPDHLDEDCRRLLGATEQLLHSCDDMGQSLHRASAFRLSDRRPPGDAANVNEPDANNLQPIHRIARVGRP